MADAIVQVHWRSSAGRTVIGRGMAKADIVGTCFTLASGITLTALHNTEVLFKKPAPETGLNESGAFVIERSGKATRLRPNNIRRYPDYDACILRDYASETRYPVSRLDPDDISKCRLRGYIAKMAPFGLNSPPPYTDLEPVNAEIGKAAQDQDGVVARRGLMSFTDMSIDSKATYIVDVLGARVGMSGGPVLDPEGAVVGLCVAGLPEGADVRNQIGALDIREFPFLFGRR